MRESLYGPCGDKDCPGCLGNNVDEYVEACKFRKCTKEKGIEFCSFCEEYPCKELHQFSTDEWPHHWTIEPNLKIIKEQGKEKWLDSQKKEWTCRSCDKKIVWYQKTCTCGKPLDGWDVPACE